MFQPFLLCKRCRTTRQADFPHEANRKIALFHMIRSLFGGRWLATCVDALVHRDALELQCPSEGPTRDSFPRLSCIYPTPSDGATQDAFVVHIYIYIYIYTYIYIYMYISQTRPCISGSCLRVAHWLVINTGQREACMSNDHVLPGALVKSPCGCMKCVPMQFCYQTHV